MTPDPGTPPPAQPGPGVVFTRAGLRRGARVSLPLLIGMVPFGLVVGVVSGSKGLSLAEATLMSALVFAGASQLLALELWADPVPLLAVTLAVFAVNLRLAPMGAALSPWLNHLRGWRLWGSLGTLVDHSFALSVAEHRQGGRDAGFLLGMGLVIWLNWVACTVIGHLMGQVVALPPGHPGLFAAPASFVALLVPLWRGLRHDAAPWAVAAGVSLLATALTLPAPAPLMAGALAGAALGGWQSLRDEERRAAGPEPRP